VKRVFDAETNGHLAGKGKDNSSKRHFQGERRYFTRPLMYKRDIIFLVLLMAVIGLLFYFSLRRPSDHLTAVIYYENEVIDEIDLATAPPRRFSYPQNTNVVFEIFTNHQIAIVASDCPDQVCVHTGRLARSGDYAACLPNGFVIRIVRDKGNDTPAVEPPGGEVDIIQ